MLLRCINSENAAIVGGDSAILIKNSFLLLYFQVEQLTNHLKEKTDKCSELLLSKEQLQRDIQERNEEIEKLEFRVRELEQALLVSADTFQKV